LNKGWRAILRKEIRSELRQLSGLTTTFLFGIFTVVTISFATFDLKISPQLGSGLLSVALLFAAIVALPRIVLIEEEQGTGDLLRLVAKPEDVFWGKAIYMLLTASIITGLFLGFTNTGVAMPLILMTCILGSCAAYAGTVTLCGALVSHASNRTALAGVLAVPLLLPLSSWR
jgi:ABC-type transport system involved in cytochrome c biogenesis permease component